MWKLTILCRCAMCSNASVWGYETKLDDGGWALGPQFKVQVTRPTQQRSSPCHLA